MMVEREDGSGFDEGEGFVLVMVVDWREIWGMGGGLFMDGWEVRVVSLRSRREDWYKVPEFLPDGRTFWGADRSV